MSSSHSLDRPILAQELVEHIFTFLNPVTDPESRSALRICAYASPSLCIISQKRLFYEVILDHSRNIEDTPPTVSPPHLALILDTSPHIAAYIRSLKIFFFESPYVADPDDYTHRLCRDYDVSCIHLLVNLQEISLSAKTEPPILQINRSQVMWGNIFPAIQKTLLKVIASSSLTRLDISGVAQFPATFFHTLPDSLASLKHLSLPELKFSGQLSTINPLGCPTTDRLPSDWFSSQPIGFKHPQLDSLSFVDLSYMKHTMMWVLDPRCPMDLTRLRSLRLLFKSSDSINKGFEVEVEDISRLLRLCAGSLEDLHMNVNEEPRKSAYIMCIEKGRRPEFSTISSKIVPPITGEFQMPALKSLTFYGEIYTSEADVQHEDPGLVLYTTPYSDPFPWVMDVLRNLSSSTAFPVPSGHCGIQTITLNIFLEKRWDTNVLEGVDWVDVGATITEKNFPALARLEINIHGVGDHHITAYQTLRRNWALRKLEEKGVLVIHTYSSYFCDCFATSHASH